MAEIIKITDKVELSKRFYLPGTIITATCPKCGNKLEKDLGGDYLSYPETNNEEGIYFCCGKCDTEITNKIIIRISLEVLD